MYSKCIQVFLLLSRFLIYPVIHISYYVVFTSCLNLRISTLIVGYTQTLFKQRFFFSCLHNGVGIHIIVVGGSGFNCHRHQERYGSSKFIGVHPWAIKG